MRRNSKLTLGDYTIHYSNPKGKGSFGKVYLAEKTSDYSVYACKEIKKQANLIDIERELSILKKMAEIRHPNIMRLFHYVEHENVIYLFLQLCDMNLKQFLSQRKRLGEHEAIYYFDQILAGVDALHSFDIMHRD